MSTAGIIPSDEVLMERQNVWKDMFSKYSNCEDADLLGKENLKSDSEKSSASSKSFEGEESSSSSNQEKLKENILCLITKRKAEWEKKNLVNFLDPFDFNSKVHQWLLNNEKGCMNAVHESKKMSYKESKRNGQVNKVQMESQKKIQITRSIDSDSEDSVDTAKYILSNRHKGEKTQYTMTIKKFSIIKSKKFKSSTTAPKQIIGNRNALPFKMSPNEFNLENSSLSDNVFLNGTKEKILRNRDPGSYRNNNQFGRGESSNNYNLDKQKKKQKEYKKNQDKNREETNFFDPGSNIKNNQFESCGESSNNYNLDKQKKKQIEYKKNPDKNRKETNFCDPGSNIKNNQFQPCGESSNNYNLGKQKKNHKEQSSKCLEKVKSPECLEEVKSPECLEEVKSPECLEEVNSPECLEEVKLKKKKIKKLNRKRRTEQIETILLSSDSEIEDNLINISSSKKKRIFRLNSNEIADPLESSCSNSNNIGNVIAKPNSISELEIHIKPLIVNLSNICKNNVLINLINDKLPRHLRSIKKENIIVYEPSMRDKFNKNDDGNIIIPYEFLLEKIGLAACKALLGNNKKVHICLPDLSLTYYPPDKYDSTSTDSSEDILDSMHKKVGGRLIQR